MITIPTECILANMLIYKNRISIKDLNEAAYQFRSSFEKKFTIYFDVCKNSIISAVNDRPDLFSWEGDYIIRQQSFDEEWVDNIFNWRLPHEAVKLFKEICSGKKENEKTF